MSGLCASTAKFVCEVLVIKSLTVSASFPPCASFRTEIEQAAYGIVAAGDTGVTVAACS